MAKDLETSERKIRTALKMLSDLQIVTIETTNHYSIITLKNWEKYQNEENFDQQTTSKRPANDQRATTEEEGKKESIKEYTDIFYKAYLSRYGVNPSPPKSAFINLSGKIKATGISKDEFESRVEVFFKLAFPPEKDLQGLITHWDKTVTAINQGLNNPKRTKASIV